MGNRCFRDAKIGVFSSFMIHLKIEEIKALNLHSPFLAEMVLIFVVLYMMYITYKGKKTEFNLSVVFFYHINEHNEIKRKTWILDLSL